MDGWMVVGMDGWMDGGRDGWTDEWSFPKVLITAWLRM